MAAVGIAAHEAGGIAQHEMTFVRIEGSAIGIGDERADVARRLFGPDRNGGRLVG